MPVTDRVERMSTNNRKGVSRCRIDRWSSDTDRVVINMLIKFVRMHLVRWMWPETLNACIFRPFKNNATSDTGQICDEYQITGHGNI